MEGGSGVAPGSRADGNTCLHVEWSTQVTKFRCLSLSFLLNVKCATLVPLTPQCTQRKQDFQPMADRVEMISLAARRERQVGLAWVVGGGCEASLESEEVVDCGAVL